MTKLSKKRFDASDEVRTFPKAQVALVKLDDIQVIRNTFEPGWRWTESIKPIAKTDSCQVHHILYVISGQLAVRMVDGSATEFGPGDVGVIPAGHDAWVVGDVPCINLDFGGAAVHAKSSS